MTFKSMSIGEAVRVHMREESYRSKYRLARSRWKRTGTTGQITASSWVFREALYARARWSALAEIIEAEERRVAPRDVDRSVDWHDYVAPVPENWR